MVNRIFYILLIITIIYSLLENDVENKQTINFNIILLVLNVYIIYKYNEKIKRIENKIPN